MLYVSWGLVTLYLIVDIGVVSELGFGDTYLIVDVGVVCALVFGDTVSDSGRRCYM